MSLLLIRRISNHWWMPIIDQHAFDMFCSSMVYSKYVTFAIAGNVDVRIKGYGISLTVPSISFDKSVTIEAFGGPPAIDVIDFRVSVDHNNDVRGVIVADIHNPSMVDMALG
jgi:hypothetical protein